VWASQLRYEPLPRIGHAAAAFRGQLVIFGGQDANGVRLNGASLHLLPAQT
jgi:hypothetical protein